MKIIGFNYTKLHAERPFKLESGTKITANIAFTEIEKENSDMIKTDSVFKITFKYNVDYEKTDVHVACEGILYLTLDSEKAKEVIKKWKKKEIDEDLRIYLSRYIWRKCTLKALQLEDELGVPTHIPMPQISFSDSAKK